MVERQAGLAPGLWEWTLPVAELCSEEGFVAALGAALIILGFLLIGLFSVAGAGQASPSALVPSLAELAGGFLAHPAFLILGLILVLLGVARLAPRRETQPPEFPLGEIIALAMTLFSAACLALLFLGIGHRWNDKTLGVLAAGSLLELMSGLILTIALSFKHERVKSLHIAAATTCVVLLASWAAVGVFSGGV